MKVYDNSLYKRSLYLKRQKETCNFNLPLDYGVALPLISKWPANLIVKISGHF